MDPQMDPKWAGNVAQNAAQKGTSFGQKLCLQPSSFEDLFFATFFGRTRSQPYHSEMQYQTILGSFWARFGLVLGSFGVHFGLFAGTVLGSFWARFGRLCWARFGPPLFRLWAPPNIFF